MISSFPSPSVSPKTGSPTGAPKAYAYWSVPAHGSTAYSQPSDEPTNASGLPVPIGFAWTVAEVSCLPGDGAPVDGTTAPSARSRMVEVGDATFSCEKRRRVGYCH